MATERPAAGRSEQAEAAACPCGRVDRSRRPLAFAGCCGPYLAAEAPPAAPDAESLMRSRYTAYVLARVDYLLVTWHASQRPHSLELPAGLKWLGLEVRACRILADDRAEVEFVARSAQNGRATRLHETSRFVREAGRWFYVDGELR